MGPRRRSLERLAACLRGLPAPGTDWVELIEAANQSLVTPFLAHALKEAPIPDDVSGYLAMILDRNRQRNERLRAQLAEAAAALNAGGIMPTALKGGAWLMTASPGEIGLRIMADLDLMVPVEDMPRALAILSDLGYVVDSKPSDLSHHFQADLRRASDAAMIDLHRRPPGPAAFHDLAQLRRHCTVATCGKGQVLVPSPTFQAFHLLAHDLFHDGDYWLGHVDLRHLVDLAMLARSPAGIDVPVLRTLTPGLLGRRALATQLITLHRLLAVEFTADVLEDRVGRLQYRRRLLQLDRPGLRIPLTGLTVLSEWRGYRELRALNADAPGGTRSPETSGSSSGRLERWTRLLTSDGIGKL